MVKIRLRRMGGKKNPFYRIVVADSRSPRDGRCIEEIGTYDPHPTPVEVKIDIQRAQYWLGRGAQPTEKVKALIEKAGKPAAAPAEKAAPAKQEEPQETADTEGAADE